MAIDREVLVEEMMWRGAIPDRGRAEAALEATLESLGERLSADDAAAIAEALPAALAAAVVRRARTSRPDLAALYEHVAARARVSRGLAVEHARAACEAVGATLDDDQRLLLAHRLPPDWAALFAPPRRAPAAEIPRGTAPGHGHTLATGRPGSAHPIAEAASLGSRAQADSVVASENPHGDSKVSSARPVQAPQPLATSRPGAEYPIAEGRDERPGGAPRR